MVPGQELRKRRDFLRLGSRDPGLRGLQNSIEDRGGGAPEGVGGRKTRLVCDDGNEGCGPGVVQASRVDAHSDHGRRLDEGGHLLVEAGGARNGRSRDAGEDLLIRGSGAEDETVRARAVQ
jgi:hypothetical protein